MATARFYGVKSSKGDGVFAASDLVIAQSRTRGVKGSVIKAFQDYENAYRYVYGKNPTKADILSEKVTESKVEKEAEKTNSDNKPKEDVFDKETKVPPETKDNCPQKENVVDVDGKYVVVLTTNKEGLFLSKTHFENYKKYLSEAKNKNVGSITYNELSDAVKCLDLNTNAKKYYVVCAGPNAGIYTNKKFYKKNKDLYSKKCKAFERIREAVGYYKKHMNVSHAQLGSVPKGHCVAYVDGSYQDSERVYSSGIVLLFHDKRVEIQQTFNDPTFLKYRNISGEVNSVILAVNEAILNGVKHLTIRHDLKDLNGEQAGKRKSEIWKIYDRFLDSVKDKIEIEFQKVTAHNKNLLNEFADNLAKNAIEEHMFKGRKTEMYFQK